MVKKRDHRRAKYAMLRGGVFFVLAVSGVVVYAGMIGASVRLVALVLFMCVAIAAMITLHASFKFQRDLESGNGDPNTSPVLVSPWSKTGNRRIRGVKISDQGFSLEAAKGLSSESLTMWRGDDERLLKVDPYPSAPGLWKSILKDQDIAFEVPQGAVRGRLMEGGKALRFEVNSSEVLVVTRKSILADGREVCVRDALGWRLVVGEVSALHALLISFAIGSEVSLVL
jgi:hypothetical protein